MSSATTASGHPKGEVVELDNNDEEKEEDMSDVQYSPREVNLGLGKSSHFKFSLWIIRIFGLSIVGLSGS